MSYKGILIEESIKDSSVLKDVQILETNVEQVTEQHKTPWLKKWTLHTIEVADEKVDEFAQKLSRTILTEPVSWYVDFRNKSWHYIVFPGKIFKVDRTKQEQYDDAKKYGVTLGIPEYQLTFSSEIKD